MEILCLVGPVPGVITATVSHGPDVRSFKLEMAEHPDGGWHGRSLASPMWGLRCHTVHTAVLLEAADMFADAPMLLAAD